MEELVNQIKGAVDGLPAMLASLEPLADEIVPFYYDIFR